VPRPARDDGVDGRRRGELVEGGHDEERRHPSCGLDGHDGQRGSDGDPADDCGVLHAQADRGAEGVPDDEQGPVRHVLAEDVEGRPRIEALPGEVATLGPGARTEVETQGGDARLRGATGTGPPRPR
jgi:hypothetical protein